MRLLGYLLLILIIAFAAWPYYHIYRLDDALGKNDMTALARLIDVEAIRGNYKRRIERGLGLGSLPRMPQSGSAPSWLVANLKRLGDAALEQTITLAWARENLKEAAARASGKQPPNLIAGIDFAFFESYDRFLFRLGELGMSDTNVRMGLRFDTGRDTGIGLPNMIWRVTDIIR